MVEQAGVPDGFRVVGGARGRVGHPDQPTVQVAGDLEVQAGAVVLARVQAGLVPPVPARHEGAVDEQGPGRVEVVHGGDEVLEGFGQAGRPPADGPGDGGLVHVEGLGELGLGAVTSVIDEGESDFLFGGQRPGPACSLRGTRVGLDEDRAQGCHCGRGETCCMIHVRTCFEIFGHWLLYCLRAGPHCLFRHARERESPKIQIRSFA